MAKDRSPDWRRQLIYFLLPDRFSDTVPARPALDPTNPHPLPPNALTKAWYWNLWAISGRNRFQGGTIKGITSRLDYLKGLGVTALWLGPVWKQRAAGVDANANGDGTDDPIAYVAANDRTRPITPEQLVALQMPRDDSHGYAIQDFTEVDPRFGTKKDLRELCDAAHRLGMYVIFDIMFNHSAENFTYDVPDNPMRPPYVPVNPANPTVRVRYPFGSWLDSDNRPLPYKAKPRGGDEGVWPKKLQDPEFYTRAGRGNYGSGDDGDESAEFRVSDYRNRDFYYPPDPAPSPVLKEIVRIWCGWIDETGCDGVRIDTFKHVPKWVAEQVTQELRAHAAKKHNKRDFLVFGEVAGGDYEEASYIPIPNVRLLELSERRNALRGLARGDATRARDTLTPKLMVGGWDAQHPSKPLPAERLIMTIDDHDGLWEGPKQRLAASGREHVLPAVAYLLFGPSIPCLYYGTEQALRGPVDVGGLLDPFGLGSGQQGGDRYLREAMFGPQHPRRAGRAGRPTKGMNPDDPRLFDPDLPGFGPGGSAGVQVFDAGSPWYQGIAALAEARRDHTVLATGAITLLGRGRIGGGGCGANISDTVVAWIRYDAASGAWGVVAVDLRGSDQSRTTIDVALPVAVGRPAAATRTVAIEPGTPKPNTNPVPTRLVPRPQTGETYLSLEGLLPGEIRVYVSP
jgi:glycosidase